MNMRNIGLALITGVLVVSSALPARASVSTRAYKIYTFNFQVQAPVVMRNGQYPMVASSDVITYDVPPGPAAELYPRTIAANTPQGNIPVQFNAKADPYAAYLSILPQSAAPPATAYVVTAGSTATFTCAIKIKAYFPTAWHLVDWVFGTASGNTGSFPTYNNPTVSDMSWLAEGYTTSFTHEYNNGAPGEAIFQGAAGSTATVCIDYQFAIPSTIAPGDYSAVIEYSLQA